MSEVKQDQIILVHYVQVSDLTKEKVIKNDIDNYKNIVDNQLQYDNIINVYVPTMGPTHIERIIN